MRRFSRGIAAALAWLAVTAQAPPLPLAPGNYQLQCSGGYTFYHPACPPVATPTLTAAPPIATPTPTVAPTPPPLPSATPTPSIVTFFPTLPPKAALPAETWCAQQVRARPIAEVVPSNPPFNSSAVIPTDAQLQAFHANPQPFKGDSQGIPADYQFADGKFYGTTDELIRNAACKWGIDEDVIRAEAVTESGQWMQKAAGDRKTVQSQCVQNSYPQLQIWNTSVLQPGGNSVTCSNCCYQSWGITQNKLYYEPNAFPYAVNSTAFTLDLTYAKIRACMNGNNQIYFASSAQQPNTYAADIASGNVAKIMWGCIGYHFSGGWYTPASNTYIAEVQGHLSRRDWP